MEEQENAIDFNDLYLKTYNRIAKWHNEVPDMPPAERNKSLHLLTHIILQDSLEKIGSKLSLPLKQAIPMSKELREKIDEIKSQDSTFLTGDKRLNKMLGSDDTFVED